MAALAALVAVVFTGCAGSKPAPGGEAPLLLQSPEGTSVSLDALRRDRAATVLVFWSGSCPCARRYQERIDGLLDRYPPDRVRVIGVSSNAGEDFAQTLRVARERGVRVPIYRDEDGRLARSVGARSTPTAVVLDEAGKVRFLGWIDNERLPGDPGREPWLDRAIQGVLDGRHSFAAKTPVYGCIITRSLIDGAPSSCPCSESNGQKEKTP